MKIRDILYRAGMKWSLKKLLILLWVVSFVPCILVTVSFVASYQREMHQTEVSYQEQLIKTVDQRLNEKLTEIRSGLYMLANRDVIKDFLNGDALGRFELLQKTREMISDLEYYVPLIRNCALVIDRDSIVDGGTGKSLFQTHHTVRSHLIDEFLSSNYQVSQYRYFAGDAFRGVEPLIAVMVPTQNNAIIFAWVDVMGLFEAIGLDNEVYSVRWNDQVVQSNSPYMEGNDLTEEEFLSIGDHRYRLAAFKVDALDWEITIAMLHSGFFEVVSGMGAPLILALLFMLSGILLTLSIYLCIIMPLRDIAALARQTDEKIINPYGARSELDMLVGSLNEYRKHIRQLADEVNAERLMRMQNDVDRLRAMNLFLQAQINPHMLYNMLECICGMAVQAGVPNIRNAALTLAQLYRYCAQSDMATLEEEMGSVELFESIMNYRQEKVFSLEWDIEEELQSVLVPRMILEPIVENSVKHGFLSGGKANNIIRIGATYCSDHLQLTVEDNGCGIVSEQLEAMKRELENVHIPDEPAVHIGIRNVNSRIRYLYGPDCGLDVAARSGGGTVVTITIGLEPLRHMEF